MRARPTFAWLAAALLLTGTFTACGDGGDDGEEATPPTSTTEEPMVDEPPTAISIIASDYRYEMPPRLRGGLASLSFSNTGTEPHLAAFATIAPGKTFDDVRTALSAPPAQAPTAGPPPFEDITGFPTTDPGLSGNLTVNLPAGDYVLYCPLPSPDGTSHVVKGMITEVTVAPGTQGDLPASTGTVNSVDFGFTSVPTLEAGTNVLRLTNGGRQAHEINLIELGSDTTIEEVVTWFKQPSGPPPMRSLSGVFVRPGLEATTELDLTSGSTYAFVCAIPDFLGDFQPHVTKGMFTSPVTVS